MREPEHETQPVGGSREMLRNLPFPFLGDTFPASLGAVVQKTVLDGVEPAREVVHFSDGSWAVGDGRNDPTCLAHRSRRISSTPSSGTVRSPGWRRCRQGRSLNGGTLVFRGGLRSSTSRTDYSEPGRSARSVPIVSASAGVLSSRYRSTRANRSATPPG